MDKRRELEEVVPQQEHRFPQDNPHRTPPGCSGVSAYVPTLWLRAYKTVLADKGMTMAEDLNRHVIDTVIESGSAVSVWDLQREIAARSS